MSQKPAVWAFVVDDDPSVRKSLGRLLRLAGYQTAEFATASEFLQFERPEAPSCLLLDLQMPELGGLELQEALRQAGAALPIIFVTGQGDIPSTVQAMKAGAADFLLKPIEEQQLLQAVGEAVVRDINDRRQRSVVSVIRRRIESLSPREREVLGHVVNGTLNKSIARRLSVTEKTIKVHRGQVMRKMQASSVAELVRLAAMAGVVPLGGDRQA